MTPPPHVPQTNPAPDAPILTARVFSVFISETRACVLPDVAVDVIVVVIIVVVVAEVVVAVITAFRSRRACVLAGRPFRPASRKIRGKIFTSRQYGVVVHLAHTEKYYRKHNNIILSFNTRITFSYSFRWISCRRYRYII